MVFDPIWETMQGSSGVTHSDILGDNRTDPANDAFCERARYRRHFPMSGVGISMDDSISCGCELCRLYYTMYCLARIGPGLWRMDRGEVKARLLKFEKKGPSDCIMHTFGSSVWEMCNGKLGEENLQYFLIEARLSLQSLPVSEPLPKFTGSDESFRFAEKRLEHCLKEHSRLCCGSQKLSPLPKRVLDLGCFPDGIRLLEDSDETAPYICLSHCWGDATYQPLRTTSRNLSSHRRGIPFADLPKTFQEAATYVRRLGYRYLWIDSLCIIQDDFEDWSVQASRMTDIYQGCLLTIAAAAAVNSAQGLFSHSSLGSRGVLLSDLTEKEDDRNVWIRQDLFHEREPLDARGWVLQERALSPRTLYFGKDELTWECLEAAACQCGQPRSIPGILKSRVPKECEYYSRSKKNIFHDWYHVVNEYSNLQLSREEDIFPAISGISKQFRTLLGSQYIAGLWRDDISLGLCWYVVNVGSKVAHKPVCARRSTEWRAPSFSWANVVLSQGSHISHWWERGDPDRQCVKLIDVHCAPVGTDDTGQLSDAYIDLEGTLVAAAIIKNFIDVWRWDLESDSYEFRYCHVFPDYDYDINGPHQNVNGNEVFCLLVSEAQMDPGWSRVWLILRQTKRRQDVRDDCGDTIDSSPVYERVGLLKEDGKPRSRRHSHLYPHPVDVFGSRVVRLV